MTSSFLNLVNFVQSSARKYTTRIANGSNELSSSNDSASDTGRYPRSLEELSQPGQHSIAKGSSDTEKGLHNDGKLASLRPMVHYQVVKAGTRRRYTIMKKMKPTHLDRGASPPPNAGESQRCRCVPTHIGHDSYLFPKSVPDVWFSQRLFDQPLWALGIS